MIIILINLIYVSSFPSTSTVTLPSDSSHLLSLSPFYQGNDLSFTIKCSPTPASSKLIQSPSELSLIQSKPHEANPLPSIQYYQMGTISIQNLIFSFYFTNNSIILIQTNTITGESLLSNKAEIVSLLSNFQIESILPLPLNTTHFSILVLGKGLSHGVDKYEFFIVFFTVFNKIYFVNQLEVTGLDNLSDFFLHSGFNDLMFVMTGKKNKVSIIFVMQIFYYRQIAILKRIEKVSMVRLNESFVVDPVSVKIFRNWVGVQLLVLDSKGFFIHLLLDGEDVQVLWVVGLKEYGRVMMMYVDYHEELFLYNSYVWTNKGIVLISSELLLKKLIFDMRGFWNVGGLGVYSKNDELYVLYINYTDSNMYLAVSSMKIPDFYLRIFKVYYKNFGVFSPWSFIPGISQEFLLRIDQKRISLLPIKFSIPKLIIKLKAPTKCEITATGLNISYSFLIDFTIMKDLVNPNLIYKGQNFIKPLEADFSLVNNEAYFELPTFMVSGWNIECQIESFSPKTDYYDLIQVNSSKISLDKLIIKNTSATYTVVGSYMLAIHKDFILLSELGEYSFLKFNIQLVSTSIFSSINQDTNVLLFCTKSYKVCTYLVIFGRLIEKRFAERIILLPFIPVLLASYKNYLAVASKDSIFIYKLNLFGNVFIYDLVFNQNKTDLISHLALSVDRYTESAFILYVGHKGFISVYYGSDSYGQNKQLGTFESEELLDHYQIIAETSKIFVVTKEKILVYDSYFTELMNIIEISLKNIFLLDEFLIGENEDSYFIINSTENFLYDSVYYLNDLSGQSLLGYAFNAFGRPQIIIQNLTCVSIFNSNYPKTKNENTEYVQFSFKITDEFSLEFSNIHLNIIIGCKGKTQKLDLDYSVLIHTHKNVLSVKKNLTDIKADHTVSQVLNLHDYYSGYNLTTSLYLDSIPVDNHKISPLTVTQSLKDIHRIGPDNKLLNMTDLTLIRHKKMALITTFSGQMYSISDIFSSKSLIELNIPFMKNRICHFVKNYGSKGTFCIFVLTCIYYQPHPLPPQPQIIVAVIDLANYFDVLNYSITNLSSKYINLQIIWGSLDEFAVAVIEVPPQMFRLSNFVEIFKVTWKNDYLDVIFVKNLNYFSLGLTKFYCNALDGTYSPSGTIDLYLADRYYGLRTILIDSKNSINLAQSSFKINSDANALSLCENIILVSCSDTSILIYRKVNKKISLFQKFPPYTGTNNDDQYHGSITCNTFYNPRYFIVSFQTKTSTLTRIYDITAEYSNVLITESVLNKVEGDIIFFSGGVFFNETVLVFFESLKGNIFTFVIQDLTIKLPILTNREYDQIQSIWGKGPYSYQVNVSNGRTFLKSEYFKIDRGNFKSSSAGKGNEVAWYLLFSIIFIILISLGLISYGVYKAILKRKKVNISKINTVELNLRYSERCTLE